MATFSGLSSAFLMWSVITKAEPGWKVLPLSLKRLKFLKYSAMTARFSVDTMESSHSRRKKAIMAVTKSA